jgi:hypothetical protein
MTNEAEDEKSKLNNSDNLQINRGFELMLRHNSKEEKSSKPKDYSFHFGKMLSLFDREINIKFSLNVNKK